MLLAMRSHEKWSDPAGRCTARVGAHPGLMRRRDAVEKKSEIVLLPGRDGAPPSCHGAQVGARERESGLRRRVGLPARGLEELHDAPGLNPSSSKPRRCGQNLRNAPIARLASGGSRDAERVETYP